MNPTTRRYSRRLGDAYPHDARYACAVERPDPMRGVIRVLYATVGCLLAVALAVHTLFAILRSIQS